MIILNFIQIIVNNTRLVSLMTILTIQYSLICDIFRFWPFNLVNLITKRLYILKLNLSITNFKVNNLDGNTIEKA